MLGEKALKALGRISKRDRNVKEIVKRKGDKRVLEICNKFFRKFNIF